MTPSRASMETEAMPTAQSTLKTIAIEVGQNQITIDPDRLAILPGDRVTFQTNAQVELSFDDQTPSPVAESGPPPFAIGSAGLTFEIKLGNINYPYTVSSPAGALQEHTSQGDLHPPNGAAR